MQMAELMTADTGGGVDLAVAEALARRLLAALPAGWGCTIVAFRGGESWSVSTGDPADELQALDALVHARWRKLTTTLEP